MTGGSRSLTSYFTATARKHRRWTLGCPSTNLRTKSRRRFGFSKSPRSDFATPEAVPEPIGFRHANGCVETPYTGACIELSRLTPRHLALPGSWHRAQRSDRSMFRPDFCRSRFNCQRWAPVPCETTATVPKAAWPAVRRRSHPVARASAGPFVPCVSPHRLGSRTSGAPSRQSFGTLERPFNVVIGSSWSRRGEPT